MLNNNAAFKYYIPYKCPKEIIQCCTNGTVILQSGAGKSGIIYVALSHIYLIQTLSILLLKWWMETSASDLPAI